MSQSPLVPVSPVPPTPDHAGSARAAHDPRPAARPRSPLAALARGAWRMATLNGKVMTGSAIVTVFVLVAIFGPLLIHQNPLLYTHTLVQPPSAAHWLGTNQGGQDVFAQLVVGTRTSLVWAFATGLLVLLISVTVGLVSGYFGGVVDDVLSLITNVFLIIPGFPLAIIAVQYFSRTTLTIALVVALTNWPWGARVLRAQTLSMRNREFVTAARATGEVAWRTIFCEILPNQISIVAASFITTTIQVLLAVAGLEFLGFGNTTTVSWGNMLYAAYNGSGLLLGAWWWFAPPGLCIALLGAGLALLNFGIDELADPRLRQKGRRARFAARAGALGRLWQGRNARARGAPGHEKVADV
ncbi:MAG TPA: ABC transporter permease [Ktedonobacterales bacterium]|nr:ABC transporter permease [Ktedonobacterales bacterium]